MYQVLYRKYRPRVFSDVYGQDHVTSTLRNEIKNGRIAHAYLFTGSRGTGKTTCAKILAKAVNCENNTDGEPCNQCEVCKGLDNGSIYDVVEIDAASNNKVDDVRDLREEVNYTPTRGKYRVYIIDEVHMLSTGAFNALLKTLEEPPAHVIFILATTEVHKLPATILSRCQRFDFKRIQPETMAVRLNEVARLEGLSLDSDAAILIARIADGALRDGLSILDQCASRSKNIDTALVSEVAGLAGREALFTLAGCISDRDGSKAISVISDLYQNSYDMERLCSEMISHFRNYLVVKTVKKSREMIICTDDEYNAISEAASRFTLEGILNALEVFQNTLVVIKGGATARIEMEMAFVKLCQPKLSGDISSLLDRVSVLERAVKTGVVTNIKSENAAKPSVEITKEEKKQEIPETPVKTVVEAKEPDFITPEAINEELPPAFEPPQIEQPQAETAQTDLPPAPSVEEKPQTDEKVEFSKWGEFMDEIRKTEITLYSILVGSKGYVSGDRFYIVSPNSTIGEFIRKNNYSKIIKLALYNITGEKFRLNVSKPSENEAAPKRDPLDDLIMRAQTKIDIDVK